MLENEKKDSTTILENLIQIKKDKLEEWKKEKNNRNMTNINDDADHNFMLSLVPFL